MLKSGSVLDGRYKILELLGEGGNGSVWKAEELQLCRLVAIKILHALSVADHPSRRRFKREGKALATLSHKNLIGFYCFGVTEAQYSYIVMEYIEGKSVRQLLQQEKPGIERCLAIIMQACDGLYAAHNHNVIHRDLSPNNIMLVNAESGEDQVKIIDFGLSRMLDSGATNDQKLTKSGTIMGSIYYISPEHCAGREADAKSDIYSLGCVLYEMITGRTVFEAENPVGLMRKHLEEKPARLDSLLDSDLIPPGLEIALQKALAKKPEERYQSMKDFRDDLSLILQGKGASISASIPLASEEQEAARKPSLGKVSLVLLGVAITVASGFGIWKLTARQPAAQIHEDLNSEQTVLRRLRTPAELAGCTKQERVAYLGNWLREYESSDSQDAAAAHVRLAEELKDTDQVEYRLQLEGALQQYKKALEKTLKKGKGGSEATTLIGNVLNCRNLAKQLNMVPSDLIEIMDMIEGISKTELALPFLACRRELAQHYINQRQYSTALKVLDETENGKYADSMGTDATIHLYLSRAKCYRLLNRPADALKSLEGAIELSSKIKAPGSLEISVALLNEGLAQNLSPIKRLPLSLATIQAVQSTEKSHESAGPAFADAVTILIEQKQFKRALEVALNGLNWSSAPLEAEALEIDCDYRPRSEIRTVPKSSRFDVRRTEKAPGQESPKRYRNFSAISCALCKHSGNQK